MENEIERHAADILIVAEPGATFFERRGVI